MTAITKIHVPVLNTGYALSKRPQNVFDKNINQFCLILSISPHAFHLIHRFARFFFLHGRGDASANSYGLRPLNNKGERRNAGTVADPLQTLRRYINSGFYFDECA